MPVEHRRDVVYFVVDDNPSIVLVFDNALKSKGPCKRERIRAYTLAMFLNLLQRQHSISTSISLGIGLFVLWIGLHPAVSRLARANGMHKADYVLLCLGVLLNRGTNAIPSVTTRQRERREHEQ